VIKPYALDHALRLLLPLVEYGVTFEYLPGGKNVAAIVDTLSHLDNDSLKVQEEEEEEEEEEEALTLISRSINNRISNVK
jgi:hypothetical protein